MPVDFGAVLGSTSTCTDLPRITPFFNYDNTNHAEGPRKWYITTCPGDVVKVYLPAKGILYEWAIRDSGSEEDMEGHLNGEQVLINLQVRFEVSPAITVFYMHLTLREEIRAMVQESPNGYVIFDAGTHIGYIFRPPPSAFFTLDFGVHDRSTDAGLTRDPDHGWNTQVNPLDYFVDDVRDSILQAYRATYEKLVQNGTFPYSDIEDSRQNFNEQDTIWGMWFKGDVVNVWDGYAWSVVNLVKKADLHQETYWKTLEQFPTMSGLFVEEAREEVVGKPLYEGQPIGMSKFYIISGNDRAGAARFGGRMGR